MAGSDSSVDSFPEDDLSSDFDFSLERRPADLDSGTFEKRNDPKAIIKRLRMQLLNVYEKDVVVKDDVGDLTSVKRVVPIPGTTPLCNKQGVQEIISYVENYINGHLVQSNFVDVPDLNHYMLFVSQDVTQHFCCRRKDWGLSISQLDILISRVVNQIDGFLRRALFNKEREGYGETFKESYNRNTSSTPSGSGPGLMKRIYNSFARW